jgi:hypothetical protein
VSRRALALTSLAMLVVGGMAMEVDLDAWQPAWTVAYEDDAWIVFARPGLVLPCEDRRGERIEGTFP